MSINRGMHKVEVVHVLSGKLLQKKKKKKSEAETLNYLWFKMGKIIHCYCVERIVNPKLIINTYGEVNIFGLI